MKKFVEYGKARIKKNGVVGTIVDIHPVDGVVWYTVESDTPGPIEGGYGNLWALFDCTEDELEPVDTSQE